MGWSQDEVRFPKKWFSHKCPECGLRFILLSSLKRHMGWHKRPCRTICYKGGTGLGVRFDD